MNLAGLLKDKLAKKIITNSGIIFFGNSVASALGIISFAIMANTLGPKLLAFFALSQAYVAIVNDVFNVQTWESMVKFGSDCGESSECASIIKTNFLIDITSAIIAFIFALILLNPVALMLSWEKPLVDIVLLYTLVMPFTITTFTIGIPRLYNKFYFIAKLQFVIAVFKLSFITYLGFTGGTVKEFIFVYIVSEILINISLISYSLLLLNKTKAIYWWSAKLRINASQMRFIWWTNLRTIVRIPVRQLDVLVINSVISLEMVGIYKVYKEIVSIISRLSDPVNQALYPEYARLIGKNRADDAVSVTRKIVTILSAVSAVITVAMLVMAEFLVGRFFGSEYLPTIMVLYILIVLFGVNLFLTPINSLFIAAGFAKNSFYIVLTSNLAYLFVVIVGGKMFGLYGVILAFGTQMVLNQGMKIILLKKYSTGWSTIVR